MAFHVESGTGDKDVGTILSEINITPMVDVMLVLLVIFMVTAPLMNSSGVSVQLPEATAAPINESSNALWISIDKKGTIFIENRPLTSEEFESKFQSIVKARAPKEVFLRADQSVPYGIVAKSMAAIQAAGVFKIGMITETPSGQKKGNNP